MLLLALAACAGSLVIEPAQDGCTDVDYNNLEASKIVVEPDGAVTFVRRTNVLSTGGLLFDPTIETDGREITVREAWVAGEEASDDQFCYTPSISLSGAGGSYQVRWYEDADAGVPFDTVEVEL